MLYTDIIPTLGPPSLFRPGHVDSGVQIKNGDNIFHICSSSKMPSLNDLSILGVSNQWLTRERCLPNTI